MEILVIFMLPGYIVFDLIPQAFSYMGLTDWYIYTYRQKADVLIGLVYLPFCALLIYLALL